MRLLASFLLLLSAFCINACSSSSFDCDNLPLQVNFIGYTQPELDTLYIQKYQANTGYATVLQTDTLSLNKNLQLNFAHDTASCLIYPQRELTAGFDWNLLIPAVRKTITFSDFVADQNKGKCNRGIFSMDPFGCQCSNQLHSVKIDGQMIDFPNNAQAAVYLHK